MSTPSRAGSASPAMSPQRERREVNPNDLTPRSKVKAMLAALDAESDDEPSPKPKVPEPSALASAFESTNVARKMVAVSSNNSSDMEDQAVARRPKGGLAAKLQTGMSDHDSMTSSEEDEPVGAYARIRKQLLAENTDNDIKRQGGQREDSRVAASVTSDDASEEDVRAKPRRRIQHQRPRSLTPDHISLDSPSRSPGLFVTPHKEAHRRSSTFARSISPGSVMGSDSDLPDLTRITKMAKRKAANGDVTTARARGSSKTRQQPSSDPISAAESDNDDVEAASIRAKLTQQARPTRKAGRKALEEMQKETQRMSRNMQLGHREKTRKKFTTKDLFQKFNFNQGAGLVEAQNTIRRQTAHTDNEPTGMEFPSILGSSDAEGTGKGEADTPPTSPPSQDEMLKTTVTSVPSEPIVGHAEHADGDDEELPDLDNLMSQRPQADQKGKGRSLIDEQVERDATGRVVRLFRIKPSDDIRPGSPVNLDFEDEEEDRSKNRLAVFDKIVPRQAQQSHSLLVQRALSHVTSPGRAPQGKRGIRSAVTPADVQNQLRLKAHQQALEAKRDRIEQLRAKGVYIETQEEKKEREEYVANSLQKAREDAALLAEREREERQREGRDDVDMLSSDEGEDWYGDAEIQDDQDDNDVDPDSGFGEEQEEIELSGSSEDEESQTDAAEEQDGDDESTTTDPFLDRAAEEAEEHKDRHAGSVAADENAVNTQEIEEDEPQKLPVPVNRQRRRNIIEEEDDDDEEEPINHRRSPEASQDDALEAFGFNKTSKSPVTMTQMFAGTMADLSSQSQIHLPNFAADDAENSLAFLRELPTATLPDFRSTMPDTEIDDSQRQQESQIPSTQTLPRVDLGLSQLATQSHLLETPSRHSEAPDPTQDAGFMTSPNFLTVPHSTTDTVLLEQVDSPVVVKKKGRLTRRQNVARGELSDEEVEYLDKEQPFQTLDGGITQNGPSGAPLDAISDAFRLMQKAAERKANREIFNKQNSKAKEMMDEQAEESEDEYAGIGGASDDDIGEEDEEDRAMIDNANVKVDERKIAALHAYVFLPSERLSKELTKGSVSNRASITKDGSTNSTTTSPLALYADAVVVTSTSPMMRTMRLPSVVVESNGTLQGVLRRSSQTRKSASLQRMPNSRHFYTRWRIEARMKMTLTSWTSLLRGLLIPQASHKSARLPNRWRQPLMLRWPGFHPPVQSHQLHR